MGYALIGFICLASGIALGFFVFYEKRKRLDNDQIALHKRQTELLERERQLKALEEEVRAARNDVISFDEIQHENAIMRTDLQNIEVECRKLQLDHMVQGERQDEVDQRCQSLAERYLGENVKWIGTKLTPNNYVNSKAKLVKVIELCRAIGFEIPESEEEELLADLKAEYEKVLRADFERQEQARIKAQIREEQKLEREVQKELEQLERERAAIQAALEKALQETEDEHSAEIERLRTRLQEAEEKSQRAVSRAQMTRSGHVYVISNIGAFGEDVFKIGMTRRLEPEQRVKELSSASVPFPYDVHMMISCDDAPALESCVHKALHKQRLNRMNLRKEFFRTDIDTVRNIVEDNHGEVSYVADAEALEYYQSREISDEDYEFIEQTYNTLEDEENSEPVD